LAEIVGAGATVPDLLVSGRLAQPVAVGLSRPAIILPEGFIEDEPRCRLEAALAHEWAHFRNRDLWWIALSGLLMPLLFAHPVYWWLRRRTREDQELLADAAAAEGRLDYAEALLSWARRMPQSLPVAVAGSLALWERPSQLKTRIIMLLDTQFRVEPTCPRRWGHGVRAGSALAVLALSFTTFRPSAVGADRAESTVASQSVEDRGVEAGRDVQAPNGQAIKAAEPATDVKHDPGKIPARDIPIAGRIVDLEGRPTPGVTVKVAEILRAKGGDLTPWLEAVRQGEPPWVAYRYLEQDKEKPPGKAETDAQGRFHIDGLGAEKVVYLLIEGPTVAHTQFAVVTRRVDPFSARGFTNEYGPGSQTIYGADLTLSAPPGRVVEGVVRDTTDKKVMKDVDVWSDSFSGSNFVGIMTLKTRTDAEGRFRLAGFPKGPGNKLLIVPNDDQPYFMQETGIPDPPGLGTISVEVGLHKGLWIEGKLTDKETGEPVAGAWLHYLPFFEDTFARTIPEFHPGGYVDGGVYQRRYMSKADGTFRLVGLPGRAIVGAVVYTGKPYRAGVGADAIKGMDEHGHFATYSNPVIASRYFPTSMKEINPAEGTETVHLDLTLDPGAKVHLRVVDPHGKPVAGVKTGGNRRRGWYGPDPEPQAEFDVATLGPGEDRLVWLVHEGRKLGRVIHVKEGDDRNSPVVVALEPSATITGRIVGDNGDPLAGATIRPILKPGGSFALTLPEVASGEDGRFTLLNVPTGCEYSLVADGRFPSQGRFAVKDAATRPGETTDVGEIQLKQQ
jgi:protocatechuate 3,4-dioxygenase beta subunit